MTVRMNRVAAAAAGILASVTLVGCTPDPEEGAGFEAAAESSTLKTVLERGTLKVGD